MKLTKLLFIFIMTILFSGCDGAKYQTNSDSKEFSGAVLGGDLNQYVAGKPLEIDGGPYYFTKNKSILRIDKNNKIIEIEFLCKDGEFGKSNGVAIIDGMTCNTGVSSVDDKSWSKLCYLHSFEPFEKSPPILATNNNAFIQIHYDQSGKPYVFSLGLTSINPKLGKSHDKCEKIPNYIKIAKSKGYSSLGEMFLEKNPRVFPRMNVSQEQTDADYDLAVKCSALHGTLAEMMESINKRSDLFEENFRAFTIASLLILISNGYHGENYSADLAKKKHKDDFNNLQSQFASSVSFAPGGAGVFPGPVNSHILAECGQLTSSQNYKTYYDHIIANKILWDRLMNN